MNRRVFLQAAGLGTGVLAAGFPRLGKSEGSLFQGLEKSKPFDSAQGRPNIVYILCDDLGYGDVHALNPESGKIPTPNMDRLVAQGMVFTDAHSGSSVCTPTRYGILTGRYSWRSRLQSGVLGGLSPRLIEADRLTVPALLKQHGYHTAAIGKWHLGMDWVKQPGKDVTETGIETPEQVWNVDYAQPIANGPTTVGFDYFFGISASLDMVPYTFIENDRVAKVPTEEQTIPLMPGKKGMTRKGPAAAGFTAMDVLPTLTRKAVDYIAAQAGKPFFLYLPLNAPHTPIVPSPEWQGKSGLNPYGDYVMQTDAVLGTILHTLDLRGLTDNTLVIFTSDNGCSPEADLPALRAKGHNPCWVLRGNKFDIWDGGHRIPFVARWPGHIKAGVKCDQLICLNDFMATSAEIIGAKLPANAGEDSVSILPALRGDATAPLREAVIHHSCNGKFAIRQGRWKLEFCPGSGGWSYPGDAIAHKQGLPSVQLYDMTQDISESKNQQAEQPELVARLTKLLEKYVAAGRSTPGVPQKNAVPVDIWKTKPT